VAELVRPGAGVIWARFEDRYAGQIVVSKDIAKDDLTAKKIAARLGERFGVRGGGRDTSAQVGGKIDEPMEAVVGETWSLLASIMEDAE
jgi:alanyl-tRNA synthetase